MNYKNTIYYGLFLLPILLLPTVVAAEVLSKTRGILESGSDIITKLVIPIVFTLAVLFFFYGVTKYIWSEGDKKEDGRKVMVWGVVALFVMSSVWGLVAFIRKELLGNSTPTNMKIPTIGGSGGGNNESGECIPDPISGNPCP
jgi:ribose/xylose/arabinose/galactoside ABC-type transport system permease subunit